MTKLSDAQAVILQRRRAARGRQRPAAPRPRSGRRRRQGGASASREADRGDATDSQKGRRRAQPHLAQRRGARPDHGAGHPPALTTRASPPSGSSRTATARPRAPTRTESEPARTPADAVPAPKARTPRAGTKQEKLIEMLRAEGGATIDEIVAATQWQPHTIRGAFRRRAEEKARARSHLGEGRGSR